MRKKETAQKSIHSRKLKEKLTEEEQKDKEDRANRKNTIGLEKEKREKREKREKKYQKKQKERPVVLPRNRLLHLVTLGIIIKLYDTPHPTLMKALYLIGIVFILGEVYMSIIKRRLKIEIGPLPSVVHKGEIIHLQITVRNTSFLPLPYVYLFFKESYYLVPKAIKCLCLTLAPRSKKTFSIPYVALNSGADRVGIERIVLVDYFEFARRKYKFNWSQEVAILSQVKPLKEIANLAAYVPRKESDELDERPLQLEDEGELSYELAPYQEGQSERLIHWKMVAQRDIYMVREREDNIHLRKEHLVMMDPVFHQKKSKKMHFKRFFRTHRLRKRWAKEREKACYRDKVITACISYLYSLLSQEINVIWMGYQEGKWEQRVLTRPSDLEQIEEMLCRTYFVPTLDKTQRWPQFEMNQYIEKTLLTAHLDATLKQYIQQEVLFKAIWIQDDADKKLRTKRKKKDKKHLDKRLEGNRVYNTKDYEFVRQEGR